MSREQWRVMSDVENAGWVWQGGAARRGAGFVLPAAIFLLVILGLLAIYLTRVTASNLAMSNLELEGERAYWAAQSGLEAAIYRAVVLGQCNAQNIALPGELARFTASVSCTAHTVREGNRSFSLFEVSSEACNDPTGGACPNPGSTSPDYADRRVRAVVEGN